MTLLVTKIVMVSALFLSLVPDAHLVPQRQFVGFPTSDPSKAPKTLDQQPSSSAAIGNFEVPISFKDETPVIFRSRNTPECNNVEGDNEFCEEDQEYDEIAMRRFDELLQKTSISPFITDVLNETVVNAFRPNVRISGGDHFVSEQQMCVAAETIIYPKRGRTQEDEWVFILNQGNVRQGVKVEKCINDNKPCRLGGGPLNMTTCRQKYIYKKLLTMDSTGGSIVSESVYMPSCCVCYVSSDFLSPRGLDPNTAN